MTLRRLSATWRARMPDQAQTHLIDGLGLHRMPDQAQMH